MFVLSQLKRLLISLLFSRFARPIRFGVIGSLATLTHLLVALFCHSIFGFYELLANVIAFVFAVPVSYFGHRYITFGTEGSAIKFFVTSTTIFLLNNTLLLAMLELLQTRGALAIGLALLASPILMFIISQYWIFKRND